MSFDRVGSRPSGRSHCRLLPCLAALAVAVLLFLSSCTSVAGPGPVPDPSGSSTEDPGGRDSQLGWSLFSAALSQWQIKFSMMQAGPPWSYERPEIEDYGFPLVSMLGPGKKAPLYKGELPYNAIIAPAKPTDVHPAGAFGWRTAPDIGRHELHNGADIPAPQGSPAVSARDGTVRAVLWDEWGGHRVEVAHARGLVTTYNHLQEVMVKTGQKLEASEQLGIVGQTGSRVTGPHLHFETWVDGQAVDPQSFDWILDSQIIPASRKHSTEPPNIPRHGPGDRATPDPEKTCPYARSEPSRCRLPDPVSGTGGGPGGGTDQEECPPGGTGTTDCLFRFPDLDDPDQCTSTAPGVFECRWNGQAAEGLEDCPAVPGGRIDCPAMPPDLNDPDQCVSTAPGIFNCVPFSTVEGPEDCPVGVPASGRSDCPASPPDVDDPTQCDSATVPGIIDCVPLGPVPGPEDCPAVEGGRLGCPDASSPSAAPSGTTLPSAEAPWTPGPSEEVPSPPEPSEEVPSTPGPSEAPLPEATLLAPIN